MKPTESISSLISILLVFSAQLATATVGEEQLAPRRITDPERDELFSLIKKNRHKGVVTFFKDNDTLDYSMIRSRKGETFGFSPLAAAIRACSKETALVLADLQYTHPWTTYAPPGFSLFDLAVKYCPDLVVDAISDDKHILNRITLAPKPVQLFQAYKALVIEDKTSVGATRAKISDWIVNQLQGRQQVAEFIEAWIHSGDQFDKLKSFITRSVLPELRKGSFLDACVALIRAGRDEDFIKFVGELRTDVDRSHILSHAINQVSPSVYDKLDGEARMALRDLISEMNIQNEFEGLAAYLSSIAEKKLNYRRIYGYFFKRYPRVDTAVQVQISQNPIFWTGDLTESINNRFGFKIENIILEAFEKDSIASLEEILALETKVWDYMNLEDLRINFAPFLLSPLKAAIMQEKPNLIKFLTGEKKMSLYATTESQLSALQMAACYKPDLLIEHLGPEIKKTCSGRLRALNHLIAMFTEKDMQKCPTGAVNAPAIFKALLDTEGLKCVNLAEKDAVATSIANDWPVELVQAFHLTGAYKELDNYINLSLKKGDLKLFKYFIKDIQNAPSNAYTRALVTWTRYTDADLTDDKVEMLEFILSDKNIKINARDQQNGASALSIATQKSIPWIVERLLLEGTLDVNLADKGTGAVPLQHSIQLFRNAVVNVDQQRAEFVKNVAYFARKIIKELSKTPDSMFDMLMKMAKEMTGASEDVLKEMAEKFSGKKSEEKDETVFDLTNDQRAKIDNELKNYFFGVINDATWSSLKIMKILEDLNGKPYVEGILPILNLVYSLDALLFKNSKATEELKMYVDISRRILEEAHEYNHKAAHTARVDELIHNFLLAHPSIDSTIENKAGLDSLYLVKNRASRLDGDLEAEDEMVRTHVRIQNIDSMLDSKRNPKRIIYGVISSVVVGSVSYGIFKWML